MGDSAGGGWSEELEKPPVSVASIRLLWAENLPQPSLPSHAKSAADEAVDLHPPDELLLGLGAEFLKPYVTVEVSAILDYISRDRMWISPRSIQPRSHRAHACV